MGLSSKENVMSSPTQDSPQRRRTLSKLRLDGKPSWIARKAESRLLKRPKAGDQFKNMIVVSEAEAADRKTNNVMFACRCAACGEESLVELSTLRIPQWQGCEKCSAPDWLVRRMKGARARCEVPSHKAFSDYGGRGIEFRFPSARDGAQWAWDHLGHIHRDRMVQLDRIDNNSHYEPGNLRWTSKHANVCNTRRGGWMAMVHKFRTEHPEIRYADKTLRNLISMGFDSKAIIDRYYQKSDKPKGVYGTFSTPDPEIASLAKDF